jgi:hypothetical protein
VFWQNSGLDRLRDVGVTHARRKLNLAHIGDQHVWHERTLVEILLETMRKSFNFYLFDLPVARHKISMSVGLASVLHPCRATANRRGFYEP